jgi:hypothetical protein
MKVSTIPAKKKIVEVEEIVEPLKFTIELTKEEIVSYIKSGIRVKDLFYVENEELKVFK